MSATSLSQVPASNDTATVMALGALAATLAAVCHETLGHGLGCIGAGGHIALLTSIWFRCSGGSAITDAGGPLGNLVAGVAALAVLRYCRVSPRVRLLVLMVGALNMFWFMGQLAFTSLNNTDDWHYVALQLGWSEIWRPTGTVAGIAGYVMLSRWISGVIHKQGGPQAHIIRQAYAAAAASAVLAGLMWRPEPLKSAFEGFLTLGIAPLGILGAVRRASQNGKDLGRAAPVLRSWTWIILCAAIYGLFLLVQARGLGPMAASPLG